MGQPSLNLLPGFGVVGGNPPDRIAADGVDIIPVVAVIEPILEQALDVFHVEKLSIVLDVIGCQEAVFLYLRGLEIFHGCNKVFQLGIRAGAGYFLAAVRMVGTVQPSPACRRDF